MVKLLSFPSNIFLAVPGEVRVRAAGTCADAGLGGAGGSEHKGGTQQVYLRLTDLFLRLEDGVYQLLVRNLIVEMQLGEVVVNLELDIIKLLLADPRPDMQRWIVVVRNIDLDEFCSRRQPIALRVGLAVEFGNARLLLFYPGIFGLYGPCAATPPP